MAKFSIQTLALAVLGASASVRAQCSGPEVNSATIDLITEFEGWHPDIYNDPVGLPTVGYGHLCEDSTCSDVSYSIPLSRDDGESLLRDDLERFQDCITLQTGSSVTLNDNQYGAIVSWAFNVGCGATEDSTLIERLNDGDSPNTVAAEELPKWNQGGGEELPGLTRRRAAEVDLHETSSDTGALPACS